MVHMVLMKIRRKMGVLAEREEDAVKGALQFLLKSGLCLARLSSSPLM